MKSADPVYFLLVDDLEENLLALHALLRRDGLVLLHARSGPEALEHLLKYDVALALIDVQMPGMDGFELAELIRGTERTRRVPIIFVTAQSPGPQWRFRGYEAGAVDFIPKPIETDVLRSKADVFFELYRQRQEVARQCDELQLATAENARLLENSRRQSEALRDADRKKDEFLATLAHELRNPLAPIRNAIEVMRTRGLEDPTHEWARQVIDRQVKNMVRLVEDLLDVSRITTGKLVLRRGPTDLATLIGRAVESSRFLIESSRHELIVDLPPTPIPLSVDEVRMTQVFSNLLTNAAKYTDSGGRIEIRGRAVGRDVEVSVMDNGMGISAEMLGQVFSLFTQVDRSLNRSQGGLGVGLALVRRLVEMHGGTVTASSPGLGQGSTFTVRIPGLERETAVAAAAADDAALQPASVGLRILLVDDNRDAAISLAMLLRTLGHHTQTAHTGPEGLEAARSFHPDVVLLDIGLPGLNGYEVARELRADPRFADMTIIALTGWGTDEDKRQAAEAGFNSHLTKPVDPALMVQILEAMTRPS